MYSPNSRWRNRSTFVTGRVEIVAFLRQKWEREYDYRLIKELWPFSEIGSRSVSRTNGETPKTIGFRSYGNENWEFDDQGLMTTRHASINDLPIEPAERKFHWPLGRRPDDYPGLTHFGF